MQGLVVVGLIFLEIPNINIKNVSKSLECTIWVKVTRSRYLSNQYIENKCYIRFGG